MTRASAGCLSELCRRLERQDESRRNAIWTPGLEVDDKEPRALAIIPGNRIRYLAEISEQGRAVNAAVTAQAELASRLQSLHEALGEIPDPRLPEPLSPYEPAALTESGDASLATLRQRYQEALRELDTEAIELLQQWPQRKAAAAQR